MIRCCTLIDWPNSLKNSPQWSRQLSRPTLRQEGDARLTGASSKEGKCVESPPTFIWGKCQKNRNVWSTNFKCEWFGSCFYAWGRYQHPTRPSQGTKLCISLFMFFYVFYFFVFFYVFYFCVFFMLFTFLWSTKVFPSLLHILGCDEEIRPTQFFQN